MTPAKAVKVALACACKVPIIQIINVSFSEDQGSKNQKVA